MKRIRMIKVIITLAISLFSASVSVQAGDTDTTEQVRKMPISIKYCTSYDSLMADKWQSVDSVYVIVKSRTKQMWWGGKDFKFDSDNKYTNKLLKKHAFAVMYNDTLLINTAPYKNGSIHFGNGYAHAYRMKDGHLMITYFNIGQMSKRAMMSSMFGLAGAFIMASSSKKVAKQDVCYILPQVGKKVTIIDAKIMEVLLHDQQELLNEYHAVNKKDRLNAEVIMPLLRKAGIL